MLGRLTIAIAIAVATVMVAAPLAGAAKDDLTLASRQSAADGGSGADADSSGPSLSGDGRYVAFSSYADNLSGIANPNFINIFVRDLQTTAVTLVSRRSASDGGAGANDNSFDPEISADGRYVAFASAADNFVTGENEGVTNIFVRDTQTNMTLLVSRVTGGAGADDGSFTPAISADGCYVAFESAADNLVLGEQESFMNIFVHDMQTHTNTLVSRDTGPTGTGALGNSYRPSISADGRYVAFQSDANNLVDGENEAETDVFVRDTQANTTTLVGRQSAADGGAAADAGSLLPAISGDGRYVSFQSASDNLSSAANPSFSNTFLRDLQTSTTSLISRQSAGDGGAGADRDSIAFGISADGRYVTFQSYAHNLSDVDADMTGDAFVRDTQANTTTLVSRRSAADGGAAANNNSYPDAISADGRYVAFWSSAANLSDLALPVANVYVYDYLGDPPTTPTDPPTDQPPITPPADTTAPSLGSSSAKSKQKLGKPLKVVVISDENASVTASATATPKGNAKRAKKLKFKSASAQATAGTPLKLKLKPSKKTARKLKAAAKAKAQITLSATDAAGNAATRTLKIKLN